MNFDYQLSELDEKFFLKERHKKTNLIYFLLFALFYLAINIPMMMKRFWVFFTIYILFVILLILVLLACNFIFTIIELKIRQKGRKKEYEKYHFSVTKRGITQSFGSMKKEVLWENIKKVKIRKDYVFVEPKKNDIAFLFQRKTMGDHYQKLVETIEKNMKVKNPK